MHATFSNQMMADKREEKNHIASDYNTLCYKNHVQPDINILTHADHGIIDICINRWKPQDFKPFFGIINKYNSFTYLAIHSKRDEENLQIPTDNILSLICQNISSLLLQNTYLTALELEGLKLNESMLKTLSEGLVAAECLQHLSFRNCSIGSAGIQVLQGLLKQVTSLETLDLTSCDICSHGALTMASIIKVQTIRRDSCKWEHNLRNQNEFKQLDKGLRRITLNNNKDIGNQGLYVLIDVLFEDNWIKALDMQNCGLDNDGYKKCLNLLKRNDSLEILDIRNNVCVDEKLGIELKTILTKRNNGRVHTYKWLSTKCSTQKKNTLHPEHQKKRKPGIPWRIVERLNRPKRCFCQRAIGISSLDLQLESDNSTKYIEVNIEEYNSLKDEIYELKEELAKMSIEKEKLRLEIDEIKRENDELKNQNPDIRTVDEESYKYIYNTFDKFQGFLKFISDSRFEEITSSGKQVKKPVVSEDSSSNKQYCPSVKLMESKSSKKGSASTSMSSITEICKSNQSSNDQSNSSSGRSVSTSISEKLSSNEQSNPPVKLIESKGSKGNVSVSVSSITEISKFNPSPNEIKSLTSSEESVNTSISSITEICESELFSRDSF